MEVKLADEDLKQLTAEGLRAQIMKGTIEHLVAQCTPERLDVLLNGLLGDLFKNWLSAGAWNNPLADAVKKHASPIVDALMKEPATHARIEQACREGFEKAIGQIPEDLAGLLKNAAVEAMKRRIEGSR